MSPTFPERYDSDNSDERVPSPSTPSCIKSDEEGEVMYEQRQTQGSKQDRTIEQERIRIKELESEVRGLQVNILFLKS